MPFRSPGAFPPKPSWPLTFGNCLHRPEGGVVLAPAYDLLSTRYHFGRRSKMAMKLGGHYEFEKIQARHWQRFSQAVGLSFPMVRKTLEELEARLQAAISQEWERQGAGEARTILDCISRHARNIATQAGFGTPPA